MKQPTVCPQAGRISAAASVQQPTRQASRRSASNTRGPLALALAATLLGSAAQAASVEILPPSKQVLRPGETLDITLHASYLPFSYYRPVSEDYEPGPTFWGRQSWYRGGYSALQEEISSLDFRLSSSDGQSFAGAVAQASPPWVSGDYHFTLSFAQPGEYSLYGWAFTSGNSHRVESRSWLARECYFFICGSWQYDHASYDDFREPIAIGLGAAELHITVVPEPARVSLMGLGLLGLTALARRLGRPTPPRTQA